MNAKTGVALIGTGYWGPAIARNLDAMACVELLHLVDRQVERAQDTAERLGCTAEPHDDISRALADPRVQAVVIATPVRSHFELAVAALKAGKHTLVEKPLAMTISHCRQLEKLAAERDLVLMVGHIFRFNSAVEQVKSYIDSGELGDVLYVHSRRVNLGRVQADINALWSFAPHDFSILNYWFDAEPVSVQARGFCYIQEGLEDVVFCTIRYPRNIGAHLHLGWLDPRKVREMTVVGSEKMVVFDDVAPAAKIQLYDSRVSVPAPGPGTFAEWQVDIRHGDVIVPRQTWSEPLAEEIRHFLECIRDGTPCRTPGAEGTAITTAIVAAQESLKRGGSEVFLDELVPPQSVAAG
jgi:predicted dehydrogenase